MAYCAITSEITYEQAVEITEKYKFTIIGTGYKRKTDLFGIRPILYRDEYNGYWYDHFEDRTYLRHKIYPPTDFRAKRYSVYAYVPEKIKYLDLIVYFNNHFNKLRDKYNSFIIYSTENDKRVIYSVQEGIFHVPIEVTIENPTLNYASCHVVGEGDYETKTDKKGRRTSSTGHTKEV